EAQVGQRQRWACLLPGNTERKVHFTAAACFRVWERPGDARSPCQGFVSISKTFCLGVEFHISRGVKCSAPEMRFILRVKLYGSVSSRVPRFGLGNIARPPDHYGKQAWNAAFVSGNGSQTSLERGRMYTLPGNGFCLDS